MVTDIADGLLGRGAARCNAEQGVDAVVSASLKAAITALDDAQVSRAQSRHLGVGHSGDLIPETASASPGPARLPGSLFRFGQCFKKPSRVRAPWPWPKDGRPRRIGITPPPSTLSAHPASEWAFFWTGVFTGGPAMEAARSATRPSTPTARCAAAATEAAWRLSPERPQFWKFVREASACGDGLNLRAVVAAAREGDAVGSAALQRAAGALGTAVANTVQMLNPSLVVLCGELALAAGPEILQAVSGAVRAQCVATAAGRVGIRLARPKKDISAVGCALLAAEAEAERALSATFSSDE